MKKALHIGAKVLGWLLLLLVGVFLAAFLTGRISRDYTVLASEDRISLAGKALPIPELAARFVPHLHLRPETTSPPLLGIWYEAVPTETGIDLVYYFNWEDEVNPHKGINPLYALFRAAYFGYPLRDIEFFQVGVNLERGRVDRLRFETARSLDFEQVIVEHIVLVAERVRGNVFRVEERTKAGEMVAEREVELLFEEGHVQAGVATWNHLCALLDAGNANSFSELQMAELAYLADGDYRAYKFARKSQGDHRTAEPLWSKLLALGILLLVVVGGGVSIRKLGKWRRSRDQRLKE